jgi:hypothetical protein
MARVAALEHGGRPKESKDEYWLCDPRAVLPAHMSHQMITRDLRIQEAYMQQFNATQRNLGTDNLPSDPMK